MPRNTKITLRQGVNTPNPVDFEVAEPAWDKVAGRLYIKDDAGEMVHVNRPNYSFSATPPTGIESGHKWTDTDNGITYEYVYDGNSYQWVELGPTPTAYITGEGGGTSGPILQSQQVISQSVSINSGFNGFSVGPVEVTDGYTVTVPANSVWMVF